MPSRNVPKPFGPSTVDESVGVIVTAGGVAAGGVSCDGTAPGDAEGRIGGVVPDVEGDGAPSGREPVDSVPAECDVQAETARARTVVTATAASWTDDGERDIKPPIDPAAWRRWQQAS